MAAWETYRILEGKEVEMTTVRHIAHVPTAIRIIEDGCIKSGLIYDKSLLNQSRISVVWLSANWWADGSMYGTVAFEFPWDVVVGGQKIYWVEAITEYNPPAFRFLLSKRDVKLPHVQSYDPTRDDGPLRYRDGQWFRARNFTSEFMIEEDLSLDHSTGIVFVQHHPKYCNSSGSACEDIRQRPSPQMTAARMLAHVLAKERHEIDRLWKPPGVITPLTPLETGYGGILLSLATTKTGFGGTLRRPACCESVVNGALALYGLNRVDAARNLLSLINSKENFVRALLKAIRRHFGDPRWKPDW